MSNRQSGSAQTPNGGNRRGALETGTIAVMAGGVDILHPAKSANLGQELTTKGLRLYEQPIGIAPKARHFPVATD